MNDEENKYIKVVVCDGIIFRYSKLGEPFFLRDDAENCYRGISTQDWTPFELRKMADYLDDNPDCTLFSDNSGKET